MIESRKYFTPLLLLILLFTSCTEEEIPQTNRESILGFELLEDLKGHWVGSNETVYGKFEWFAFDFRPISASHLHAIYEGGTDQNIITSIFVADYEGKQQIMARNGGWLGNQYRATYFVLDEVEHTSTSSYYRLVDAVGKEKRSFMEFRFENGTLSFDAYKDNSGSLDDPIHHMGFKGANYNPSYAQSATDLFSFPQAQSEINFGDRFENLLDLDSALYLEESMDPFPKSMHGYLSDLTVHFDKHSSIAESSLLLYISNEPLVNSDGEVDFENVDTQVSRTILVQADEDFYQTTYLHPDRYYITAFADSDGNFYPSSGDMSSISMEIQVLPETEPSLEIIVSQLIP